MASYSIAADAVAVHDKALVASVPDAVTISAATQTVEVMTDGTFAVYVTTAGVPFIDPQTGPTGAWFTGTGTVGVPTGDGNADWYMSSTVANHPSQAGHDAIAARFAREISALLGLAI